VVAQYEMSPGVVATIRETEGDEFAYSIREPGLGPPDRAAMERIRDHFTVVNRRRPLTREGTAERAATGFEPKYRRALDRLIDASAAAWRRLTYHALCELRLLEASTPLALDDRIEVVDVGRAAAAYKAIALGANLVMLGRPYAYGLAAGGADGVRTVLRNFLAEFDLTMDLSGRWAVADIDRDAVRHESTLVPERSGQH
jgi:hypothetical protein